MRPAIQLVLLTLQFTCPIGLFWNHLLPGVKNCWAGALNWLLFIFCLPTATFFPFKFASLSIQRVFLSLFEVQQHSFHQFQVLGCHGKLSILIIHFMRKSTIYCFSTELGGFDYFTFENHQNLGNWTYKLLGKNWLLWSHLLQA